MTVEPEPPHRLGPVRVVIPPLPTRPSRAQLGPWLRCLGQGAWASPIGHPNTTVQTFQGPAGGSDCGAGAPAGPGRSEQSSSIHSAYLPRGWRYRRTSPFSYPLALPGLALQKNQPFSHPACPVPGVGGRSSKAPLLPAPSAAGGAPSAPSPTYAKRVHKRGSLVGTSVTTPAPDWDVAAALVSVCLGAWSRAWAPVPGLGLSRGPPPLPPQKKNIINKKNIYPMR